MTTALEVPPKSGFKKLEQGEVLFNDGDGAESLYIIQRGQIRLFKPKGRGYVEIAVLHSGEVLGEMAFFDTEKVHARSCSAEAMISSEVIEVSFSAFERAIQELNPWFRVVFNTLADRLRKGNMRLKHLESNNVSLGWGENKSKHYKFFVNNDIIRSLSVLFLVMRSHGKKRDNGTAALYMKTLLFYAQNIFNVMEVKFLEFCYILEELQLCFFDHKKDESQKTFIVKDVDAIRDLMVFFNTQKVSEEKKRIKISSRCELFMDRILEKIQKKGLGGGGDQVTIFIDDILESFEKESAIIDIVDLEDAREHGLVGDVSVEKSGLSLPVYLAEIRKLFMAIKVMNAVKRHNEMKQRSQKYSS